MTELIDAKRVILENGKNAQELFEELKARLEELSAAKTEEG